MLLEICDNIKTAVEHGRTDIIKSLLEACDDDPDENVTKDRILNQPLLEEGTFLCLATKLHRGDVVRTLLSCGADPGVQNSQGMNAVDAAVGSPTMRHIYVEELLRATANSEVGRVCQLVAAGIDVNARDSEGSGNVPLHWAACYGDREVVACLLDRGADVNAMNSFGATPLHDAMFRGDEDIVEMLLQAGANPLIQAIKGKFGGKTALDMASQKRVLKELVDRYIPLSSSPVESPLPASAGVNGFSQPAESETEADSSGQERSKSADSSGSGGGATVGTSNTEPARVPAPTKVAAVHRRGSRPPRPARQSHDYFPPHPLPLPHPHPSLSSAASTLSLDLDPHIDQQAIESLLRTHVGTVPIRPLVTHPALHLLWPQPASTLELDGPPFVPSKDLGISVIQGPVSVHRILDVWEVSRPCFLAMGYDARIGDVQPSCGSWTGHRVECLVNPELFSSADSYQIHVSSEKVQVWAGGLAGLHYALGTFVQLLRLAGSEGQLPPVLVRDRPAVAHRGVLLDVSPQGRVPALNSLFLMVNLWSSMKVNYLHLYTRLVPSSEWQLCYSRSNMVSLDRYCQDRFITVVPVLDVDNSAVYDDLADMWPSFQEILASFPNLRYVHVGPKLCSLLLPPANEGACGGGQEGAARQLWHLLSLPPSVTLMLCANSLQPAAPALPSNVVLVQYGFQADYNFVDAAQDYYARGVTMCLCPGTASWNSLAGCPEAAVCNTYRAARAAVSTGSLGVVVAHWSGSHHLTPHTFGWPGFLAGCGLAWNPDTHWDYLHNSLPDLLDAHVFLDSAGVMGAAAVGLGRAETYVTYAGRELGGGAELADLPPQGGSTLYRLLTDPDNVALDCLSVDLFARVTKYVKKCQNMFFRAKLECECAEVILREVQLSADLLLTACRIGRTLVTVGMNPNSNMGLAVINLGICNLPPTFRTDIANKLLAHIEQYKGTWLQNHLPAGLQGSLLVLTSALHRFVPDETQPS
ncbi:uncharacterized protein LOC124550870 isoform X1 [Schistocerca americana]|uniref:uncharacterized protein LOC124550870 isoform X1 n=1 Tax=Schistocerca americana TaxID=7009 RepID=UPI001F4F937D|nr:uncharacterized protein LOC124550870 isoform X1 [Schistocerca americana]